MAGCCCCKPTTLGLLHHCACCCWVVLVLVVNDGQKWVSWAFELFSLLFQLFSSSSVHSGGHRVIKILLSISFLVDLLNTNGSSPRNQLISKVLFRSSIQIKITNDPHSPFDALKKNEILRGRPPHPLMRNSH